uniref:Fibrinogen C-terminal domain-containing protein n=1 Tax=Varanus komodoensis TaxID=61221 RepID=A0A8D2Q4R0_VARKO
MRSWGQLAYLLSPMWAAMSPVALGLGPHAKEKDAPERLRHQLQLGSCTYTFLLPELGGCSSPASEQQVSNSLQRDAPSPSAAKWPVKRFQQLENIMENNTQWLQKLESYIQENARMEMSDSHLGAVQNHTATILEIGASLLNQTAEQTRKLTDVEMQVLNQTSRLEIQVLENSLTTNKLEKQLLLQTHEIHKLQERNSFLEKKVLAMEGKREEELHSLRSDKLEMQKLLSRQMDLVVQLEQRLGTALRNNTALQKQQASRAEALTHRAGLASQCGQIYLGPPEEQKTFEDCAAAYKLGFTSSGVYTLSFPNSSATAKGFGSPPGEYWLGNDFLHLLTTQHPQSLYIKLQDWENEEAFSTYEHFHVGPEEHNYRLSVRRYGGTAGRTSSLSPVRADFSTKDRDNDRCACQCAQIAGGGWWFDACGPSNLNGIYYSPSPAVVRYNGMKWHYWKGPSHALKMTTMMIRPVAFREE